MKKFYLASRYSFREDTLENWIANNPVLENGTLKFDSGKG